MQKRGPDPKALFHWEWVASGCCWLDAWPNAHWLSRPYHHLAIVIFATPNTACSVRLSTRYCLRKYCSNFSSLHTVFTRCQNVSCTTWNKDMVGKWEQGHSMCLTAMSGRACGLGLLFFCTLRHMCSKSQTA